MSTNLQYPSRIVLVVCNAAIALPPGEKVGIQARVRHGGIAGVQLAARDERVYGRLATVLLLDLPSPLLAQIEEDAANDGSKRYDTDDDSGSDAGLVGTTAFGSV